MEQSSDALCPTIFHEAWWLDIATQGAVEEISYSENGKVLGRLPYFSNKKFGLSFIKDPPLTNFLGPAIDDGEGKANKKFLRKLEITQELVKKLPKTSSIYIKCHRDVADAVAFQAAGFDVSVQFTNEITVAPVEELWAGMRAKVRSSIRGAQKVYSVEESQDIKSFFKFYDSNIKQKDMCNHMDIDICSRLIEAAVSKNRGRILQSVNNQTGSVDASICYVWDSTSAYFLLTTHNTNSAHRGVVKILIWEAIKDAITRGLVFDFDGISSTGCARSANDFTATLVPRYIIKRSSPAVQVLRAFQSIWIKRNTFF